jgi:hypothetical protein
MIVKASYLQSHVITKMAENQGEKRTPKSPPQGPCPNGILLLSSESSSIIIVNIPLACNPYAVRENDYCLLANTLVLVGRKAHKNHLSFPQLAVAG